MSDVDKYKSPIGKEIFYLINRLRLYRLLADLYDVEFQAAVDRQIERNLKLKIKETGELSEYAARKEYLDGLIKDIDGVVYLGKHSFNLEMRQSRKLAVLIETTSQAASVVDDLILESIGELKELLAEVEATTAIDPTLHISGVGIRTAYGIDKVTAWLEQVAYLVRCINISKAVIPDPKKDPVIFNLCDYIENARKLATMFGCRMDACVAVSAWFFDGRQPPTNLIDRAIVEIKNLEHTIRQSQPETARNPQSKSKDQVDTLKKSDQVDPVIPERTEEEKQLDAIIERRNTTTDSWPTIGKDYGVLRKDIPSWSLEIRRRAGDRLIKQEAGRKKEN